MRVAQGTLVAAARLAERAALEIAVALDRPRLAAGPAHIAPSIFVARLPDEAALLGDRAFRLALLRIEPPLGVAAAVAAATTAAIDVPAASPAAIAATLSGAAAAAIVLAGTRGMTAPMAAVAIPGDRGERNRKGGNAGEKQQIAHDETPITSPEKTGGVGMTFLPFRLASTRNRRDQSPENEAQMNEAFSKRSCRRGGQAKAAERRHHAG